jgi:hypothetical protein
MNYYGEPKVKLESELRTLTIQFLAQTVRSSNAVALYSVATDHTVRNAIWQLFNSYLINQSAARTLQHADYAAIAAALYSVDSPVSDYTKIPLSISQLSQTMGGKLKSKNSQARIKQINILLAMLSVNLPLLGKQQISSTMIDIKLFKKATKVVLRKQQPQNTYSAVSINLVIDEIFSGLNDNFRDIVPQNMTIDATTFRLFTEIVSRS